ncbi:HAD superfamily (subfamily IA) hydrolase, TIGR01548 [Synechococcus sp. PCC 7335]|uniref:TIGR01548 family HAD-type hydrolase n=1 Tax=Synechococcus sp. (strain ATCC 29403 / PCC 7335) TaxID=91464 RepID=UPI00017ED59A|nr:TIGR01548 family HAD-type hydrolase [Synechococcus sp. PCC 7335]EDX86651.1 HAD superfamily (subfamily IA) hydrolase, TIGR01548 [Synechococcus sp. PCC 7335]
MKPFAVAVFDIDGVIRDVGGSYRRAIADTVEHYTNGRYRPTIEDIDQLKGEGIWNNDWKASEEMIHRYCAQQQQPHSGASYEEITSYFQKRYRGPDIEDPDQWTGYISNEPLLVEKSYLDTLAQSGIPYAFFSGATQGSANFVLQRRIGLIDPILVAMEDAPSKPDPTGLMMSVQLVEAQQPRCKNLPVVYAGDTTADMKTIVAAKQQFPEREWLAIGILPPHAQQNCDYQASYTEKLKTAGALIVLKNVQQITAERLQSLL